MKAEIYHEPKRDKTVDRMKPISHESPIDEAGEDFAVKCQVDSSVKVVVKP
jgi:hypothetical protein